MNLDDLLYLDYNATTPLDPRVLDAMMPYFSTWYGNAASAHHFGKNIHRAVASARRYVSDLINAEPKELIFTSGATEGVNLALKGLALHPNNTKRHLVTVQTEHKAVLDTCKFLETLGFEITYLPVKHDGILDLTTVEQNIREDTLLVSVMLVNNETGVIQDIETICQLAHAKGALLVSDATQAVGKMPVDVQSLGVDVLIFSAHKFYGPKGIGAVYVNKRTTNHRKLQPLIHGGGHENGFRSGTLNVPAIIGFGKACELALQEMLVNEAEIRPLRDELEHKLQQLEGSFVNGNPQKRLYNVTNICLPNLDANVLIGQLRNVAMSNGSACTSAIVEASHVLKAMKLSDQEALGSLRLSLGKGSEREHILRFGKLIVEMI
jgi:cysteine desulfurase